MILEYNPVSDDICLNEVWMLLSNLSVLDFCRYAKRA